MSGQRRNAQTVVIIGLGDTGVLVASRLVKQFKVIGITTKPNLVSGQELGKRLTDLPWWRVHYNTPLKRFLGLSAVEIIQAKAQISGISGRIIEQTVTFIGKEEIKLGEKTFKTLRFNFKSSDESLPESKRLNTDIWYEEDTYLWVKAAFEKTGYWEYRIKNVN